MRTANVNGSQGSKNTLELVKSNLSPDAEYQHGGHYCGNCERAATEVLGQKKRGNRCRNNGNQNEPLRGDNIEQSQGEKGCDARGGQISKIEAMDISGKADQGHADVHSSNK